MGNLRALIGLLDEELVRILTLCARYTNRAAVTNAEIGLAGRREDRVEAVVLHVRECAHTTGLDPALAQMLWRRLMKWSIGQEEDILNKNPKSG